MEVYAIRPIAKGEELNIEYLPGSVTRTSDERRNLLAMHFNFPRCLCAVCSATPERVAQSDTRRREIRQISETIKAGRSDRKATVAKMERIRVLLNEEGYKALPDFGTSPSAGCRHASAQRDTVTLTPCDLDSRLQVTKGSTPASASSSACTPSPVNLQQRERRPVALTWSHAVASGPASSSSKEARPDWLVIRSTATLEHLILTLG